MIHDIRYLYFLNRRLLYYLIQKNKRIFFMKKERWKKFLFMLCGENWMYVKDTLIKAYNLLTFSIIIIIFYSNIIFSDMNLIQKIMETFPIHIAKHNFHFWFQFSCLIFMAVFLHNVYEVLLYILMMSGRTNWMNENREQRITWNPNQKKAKKIRRKCCSVCCRTTEWLILWQPNRSVKSFD